MRQCLNRIYYPAALDLPLIYLKAQEKMAGMGKNGGAHGRSSSRLFNFAVIYVLYVWIYVFYVWM